MDLGMQVIVNDFEARVFEFEVTDLGFEVKDHNFEVTDLGSMVKGLGFEVKDFGFEVKDLGFEVTSLGLEVINIRLEVMDFGFEDIDSGFNVNEHGWVKRINSYQYFILTQVVSMLLGYVLFVSVAKRFAGNEQDYRSEYSWYSPRKLTSPSITRNIYVVKFIENLTKRCILNLKTIINQQAAVDAALSLVEGALFGGQSQDMSAIVNKVYDILKVTRTGDYKKSIGERRSKRLQDLSPTVSTPGRAKAPPRKKSKK
ncbi:hypothetical protein LguiA_001949 [Lonicera macranthoides]